MKLVNGGRPIFCLPASTEAKCIVTRIISHDVAGVYEGASEGRHCIYLLDYDYDNLQWKGQNSWGEDDKHALPCISLHASGTKIYDVVVTSVKRLAKGKSDPGEDMGTWTILELDNAYKSETDDAYKSKVDKMTIDKMTIVELKNFVNVMVGPEATKMCLTKKELITMAKNASRKHRATCAVDKMTIAELKRYVNIMVGSQAAKKCLTREELATIAKREALKYAEKNVAAVTCEMQKFTVVELKQYVSVMMGPEATKKCSTKEDLIVLAVTATSGLDGMIVARLKQYVNIMMVCNDRATAYDITRCADMH